MISPGGGCTGGAQGGLFKRTFELRCGQEIQAHMRYERTLWLGARRGLAETTEVGDPGGGVGDEDGALHGGRP